MKSFKHCLVGEIGILIVSEHTDFTLPVQTAVKRRNHLIFPLFIEGIKTDDRVILVIPSFFFYNYILKTKIVQAKNTSGHNSNPL